MTEVKETREVSTQPRSEDRTTATNAAWFVTGLIEILLAFRFVLKLFAANPVNGFVNLIYSITNILTAPFDSIFGVVKARAGQQVSPVFEPSILVAAIVYALLGWGIVKLITLRNKN